MKQLRILRARAVVAVALVLLAACSAVAASAAATDATPARQLELAKTPPPSARQVAALKRRVAAQKRQIAKLQASVKSLRAQVAALSPEGVARELARSKAALDKYQSVDQARAAGYVQRSPCVASPAGGMGMHFENDPAMADPALDVTKPEILVYAPGPSGPVLVAAEWWKRDADQNLSTDEDRPSLFGRAFDGPMEGHNPPGTPAGQGMPRHYDLHVWLWKRNPAGMFAQWNPDVRC